jgi:hypothetical protein
MREQEAQLLKSQVQGRRPFLGRGVDFELDFRTAADRDLAHVTGLFMTTEGEHPPRPTGPIQDQIEILTDRSINCHARLKIRMRVNRKNGATYKEAPPSPSVRDHGPILGEAQGAKPRLFALI